MMQYQYQLVLEFCHYKLSSSLLPSGSISRKYLVHMEGYYRNKIIKSTEYQLKNGTQLAIPWSDRLDQILIHYYYLDDKLKMELGYSQYRIPNERGFSFDEPNRVSLDILPNGAISRIGKVLCLVSVEKFFAEEGERREQRPPPVKHSAFHIDAVVPGFRFRRLSKAVNWNKIRMIDLDRVMEMNDVQTILSCIDDVALGDAAEEDCDPRLLRALHLSQFTTQYLLSSKKLMDEKKKVIKKALHVFDEEDEVLDLKITKYKARKKAMMREMEEMDRIMESYRRTLIALKPKLHHYKLEDILKDSDEEGENVTLADYERKRRKENLKIKEKERRMRDSRSLGSEDSDQEYETTKRRQREGHGERKTSRRSERNNNDPLVDRRTNKYSHQTDDKVAKTETAWKVAKGQSVSRDLPDSDSSKEDLLYKPKESVRQVNRVPTISSDRNVISERNNERNVANNLQTTFSFEPVTTTVIQQSQRDEEHIKRANDEINEDEEDSLALWKGAKEKEKRITTIKTIQVTSRPSSSRLITPPVESPLGIDPVQSETRGSSQRETPELAMIHDSSSTTLQLKAMQHQEELVEFARKKKELWNSTNRSDASAMRSSIGFDSTNVMSVDSLNNTATAGYGRDQIVDETDMVDTTTTHEPVVEEPRIRPSPSLPPEIKEMKTWTPTTTSPAVFMDEEETEKQEPVRLVNTYPPSTGNSQVMTAGAIATRQSSEAADISSMLLESFDSNINPMIPDSSFTKTQEDKYYENDRHQQQQAEEEEEEEEEDYSEDEDHQPTAVIQPPLKVEGMESMKLSIEVDTPSPPTGNDGSEEPLSSAKLSEMNSPVNVAPAEEKLYPITNPANIKGVPISSSSAKRTSRITSSSPMYKASFKPMMLSPMRPDDVDEDDPFSPSREQQAQFRSNKDDVDASQSITIDYDLDEPVSSSTRKQMAPPKSPYSRNYLTTDEFGESSNLSSTQGEGGYNSSMTQKSSSPNLFNQTAFGSHNRLREGQEDGDNDDMVLLGTGKYPSGKLSTFTLSDSSKSNKYSDTFDRDSLAGSNSGRSTPHTPQKPPTASTPILQIPSSDINSPSGNISASGYANQSTELSPVFEDLKDSVSHLGDLSYSSMYPPHNHNNSSLQQHTPMTTQPNDFKWELGRAPVDLLELSEAIEFHISAIRFNSNVSRIVKEFFVCVEFLDLKSEASPPVMIRSDSIVQPLSYYTYLVFNEELKQLLIEEISVMREKLFCTVYVFNKAESVLLGQATLELWGMIEHSCHLLRQETNIYTPNMTSAIGSVVFDVKGHRLLTACATE